MPSKSQAFFVHSLERSGDSTHTVRSEFLSTTVDRNPHACRCEPRLHSTSSHTRNSTACFHRACMQKSCHRRRKAPHGTQCPDIPAGSAHRLESLPYFAPMAE